MRDKSDSLWSERRQKTINDGNDVKVLGNFCERF